MKEFEELRKREQEKKRLNNQEEAIKDPIKPKPKIIADDKTKKVDVSEQERKDFEEQIEMQLLSSGVNDYQRSYMPYQSATKKLFKTLLISSFLLGIIVLGGWFYTKTQFDSVSNENVDKIQTALEFSIQEYYQDNNRYPVDIHGNIDFNTLKNKGYLNLNVEEYKSIFKFDNKHNVIKIE